MASFCKLFFVFTAGLFFLPTMQAADYYMLYNPQCIDRMVYAYEDVPNSKDFVAYSFFVSATEQIILQVGSEANTQEMTLDPALLIDCDKGQAIKNSSMAEKVNTNVHQVYIAIPTNKPNRYRVVQVNHANYLQMDDQRVAVRTAQYRLNYDITSAAYQGDLSNTDPRGKVFFQNKENNGQCTIYRFLQKYDYNPDNGLYIEVIPRIGITKERSVSTGSTFALQSINGQARNAVVAERCSSQSSAATGADRPASYGTDNFTARGGSAASSARMHTVKKGETLYGIAQKYNASVNNIKAWNNLSSDVIRVNTELIVSPATEATMRSMEEKPASYGVSPGMTARGIGPSSPAAGTAKGGSDGPYATNPYYFAWLNTDGKHVVRQNETVATIARLYGYTEERFRYFNQLGEDEQVRPGDVLQTVNCVPAKDGSSSYQPDSYENQIHRNPNNENTPYYDPNADFEPYADYGFNNNQARTKQQDMTSKGGQPASYSVPLRSAVPASAQEKSTPTNNNLDYYGPVSRYTQSSTQTSQPDTYTLNNNMTARGSTTMPAPRSYSTTPSGRFSDQSQQIMQRNQLPASSGKRQSYIVQEGETLRSIARKTGISEQRLRAVNNMEKNEIVLPAQKIYLN